jgi:hypothetical protein
MKNRVDLKFIIFISLVVLLFSSFVFAQNTITRSGTGATDGPIKDLANVINQIFDFGKPLFEAILGDSSASLPGIEASTLYLSKIMFFVVIFCLLFVTLQKMPMISENNFVLWIITIAVSILATRWLSDLKLVYSFLLPYDVLGLSIAGLFPLAALFFFIEYGLSGRKYQFLRKFGWIFVGVIFIFLWITRYDELTQASASFGGWVYFISAILCFIFSFVDGTIQMFFARARAAKVHAEGAKQRLNKLYKDLEGVRAARLSGATTYLGIPINRAEKEILKEIMEVEAGLK